MASLNGIKYQLSPEQLQILAEEIKQSKYKDVTSGGICKLLNDKPLIDNPDAQGEVDGSDVSLSEAAGRLNAAEYLGIAASTVGQSILQAMAIFPDVDLSCKLSTELMATLVTEGLLTQERLTELFASDKIPDPDWQAQIPGPNRTEELLGAGWLVEGADIKTAQAL